MASRVAPLLLQFAFVAQQQADFRNQITPQTDAVGRPETRAYDGNGNLHVQQFASAGKPDVPHLVRTIDHDALNRPTTTTETVLRGRTRGGSLSYESSDSYDDAAQTVDHTDRRGAVTREVFDGLGRVGSRIVDPPDVAVEPAHPLNLVTQTKYDAGGRVSMQIDPLGRETDFLNDGLGRIVQKSLPLGLQEKRKVI
jgi:YD repeat-containing protein